MKKLIINNFKRIVQWLMPDDISIQHKLCNLIYASTLLGCICTLVTSLILTPTLMSIGTILIAMVIISISLYLSVKKRKNTLAALIIILFIDEFIFPVMYFVNGGIQSGMQIWFILGLIFTFLVLDGILCAITFVLASLTLGSCFILENLGIISPTPLEGFVWSLDVIQSMVIVAIILGVFNKLQTNIYKKQNSSLLEKEAELLEAMKKIEAANKAKSEFLANMSHEIRTPINAIMGMNEIIMRDSDDENTLINSGRIKSASDSLLSLVNNILDLSKIESGKVEIICEEYSLSGLLIDCYNMLNLRANNKGLKFIIENDPEIPEKLYGDRFHIFQIISNLLTNAVKYTKEGSVSLYVSFQSIESDMVKLNFTVKDTGVGIAADDLDKLFQTFQRIDEKNNRTIEGSGLGLSIALKLAEHMNGTISVSSVEGEGSVFTAIIPQRIVDNTPIGAINENNSSILVPSKEETQRFIAPTAKVLVVDDLYMNLVIAEGLLSVTKVQVDTALSGEDALKLCSEKKYDVIFMDHMMPSMDGIDTLHALKEAHNLNFETPVIVLTANAIKGVEDEYRKEGFDNYLSKPVHGEDLEGMIKEYVSESKIEFV